MMAEKKRTSPWVYVGVGCLVAVLAIVAVIVAIGAWGFTQVRQMQRTMEDPVTRTAAAVETLGGTALPEGYHAMVALSVPFGVMETTMLTDREPDADGRLRRFGEHGFVYFETMSVRDQAQKMRDFFAGTSDNPDEIFGDTSIRVNDREFIARGTIDAATGTLRWATYRGQVAVQNQRDVAGGLTAMVMFECAGAERLRMGIWFGPDQNPDTPVDQADFTGTVADPAEIQRFMANFNVCAGS
jgi:hypothetical protein